MDTDERNDPVMSKVTDLERGRQWEWYRIHRVTPAEAVYLAAQGLDPRLPGSGDHLAQLRADRRPWEELT